MKRKYSIRKQGRLFKIYEIATKQYIIQSKSRKRLTKLLVNLNKGGFFSGDTPRFMLIDGPISADTKKSLNSCWPI